LLEVMVVIGIIAILLALLLPAMQRAREAARQIQCASQLRQLGVGFMNYAAQNHGWLPSWSGWHLYGGDGTGEDAPGPGWTEQLERYYANPLKEVYHCPAMPAECEITYFLEARWLAINGRHEMQTTEIRRSSEFVLSGDCTALWIYPLPLGTSGMTINDCDKSDELQPCLMFWPEPDCLPAHRAGCNVLFADGHVMPYRKFDPHYMTYNPKQSGQDFDLVTSD
jgi:prepilin-type processing-associated H-X9-DG protein